MHLRISSLTTLTDHFTKKTRHLARHESIAESTQNYLNESIRTTVTMAPQARSKLATWFPEAQHPIIISAPMLGTSNGILAAEVSKAGGIGEYSPLPSTTTAS